MRRMGRSSWFDFKAFTLTLPRSYSLCLEKIRSTDTELESSKDIPSGHSSSIHKTRPHLSANQIDKRSNPPQLYKHLLHHGTFDQAIAHFAPMQTDINK
jgi:hypothetical protein